MRLNDYRKRQSAKIAAEALRSEATTAILTTLRKKEGDESDPWIPTAEPTEEEEFEALCESGGSLSDNLSWLEWED